MAEGQDKPSMEEYSKQLREWCKKKNNFPGAFRMDIAEAMWAQCKGVQIPLVSELPVLTLPLRIHLAQGPELGCSITVEECFTELVPIMNEFWTQAGIVWDLIEVAPVQWPNDVDGSRKTIECARKQIKLLVRDHSTGKMTNKDLRRSIFIDTLIPNAALSKETYDVYMFDVIGEESQGCCILKEPPTVIMGNRSSKGYDVLTVRPIPCLAKTMAHELGHALGLSHPHGRRFSDGVSMTQRHGRDNLMTGGADRSGGGGTKLEDWQILVARDYAEKFLACAEHKNEGDMYQLTSFTDGKLTWLNDPTSWQCSTDSEQIGDTGEAEGTGGSYEISKDGSQLTLTAPAKKDFWSKTFYTPMLIKSDASALVCKIADSLEATIRIDFEFNPCNQFDQAGLLVYIDSAHWVKAGIEFCDGSPRLSVVVCNEYSDWSTRPWPATSASLKIHKVSQSDSLVVEAAALGQDAYEFVRIAHLNVVGKGSTYRQLWQVGPYAACPIKQGGCQVVFSNFSVGPREPSVHSAEL